jgi:hypothetical protein
MGSRVQVLQGSIFLLMRCKWLESSFLEGCLGKWMAGSHTVLSSVARGQSGIGVCDRHSVMVK